MVRLSRPLIILIFLLVLIMPSAGRFARAQDEVIAKQVDQLLAGDLEEDASREQVVDQLVALGKPGSWALAESLERRDMYVSMTLRAALIQLDATASAALRSVVDRPPYWRSRSAMAILANIGNRNDIAFFEDYLQSEEWAMRGLAVKGIGKTEFVSATLEERLCPMLEDPVGVVRRRAAGALGEVGTAASLDALLQHGMTDESYFVRRASGRALLKLSERLDLSKELAESLIDLTGRENRLPVRIAAIEVMGHLREPVVKERLRALAVEEDWAIRAAALRSMAPKDAALVVLPEEKDPLVRWEIERIRSSEF
jgi:HEAT repeat protein